jgi:hypothetical protein
VSARPSPPLTNLAGSVRLGAYRPRVGGAGEGASSTRPVLARLISRTPAPFNDDLHSPESPALDLSPLASNAAPLSRPRAIRQPRLAAEPARGIVPARVDMPRAARNDERGESGRHQISLSPSAGSTPQSGFLSQKATPFPVHRVVTRLHLLVQPLLSRPCQRPLQSGREGIFRRPVALRRGASCSIVSGAGTSSPTCPWRAPRRAEPYPARGAR